MIIDSHTHIGTISYPVGKNKVSNLPGEDLITAMKKYSIDFALVSSIEGAEFDSEGHLAPPNKQIPQLESFRKLVKFVHLCGDAQFGRPNLKILLWIKPYTEKVTEDLEQFIIKNRAHIAGLKMHPSLSHIKFNDDRFIPYLRLAEKYNMPVQVHTEDDGLANPAYVTEVASVFPAVKFIMVHMGLNTGNGEAIDIIMNNDNVYGDTCEVKTENVIKAIKKCGSEKILFGTDAIVHGIDTYKHYLPVIENIKNNFSENEADNVLFRNCIRLYNIFL
ncbi:MAG: amidohydrolase family protein [Bacteroidales bacterium]|nr:amidohydrolase family protein [Bacteroidales bacterium]